MPVNKEKDLPDTQALVVWLTGLSGAGKTTLANELKNALSVQGTTAFVLDGDALRQGINAGLGFSDQDRNENIRRTAEVARLFSLAGVVSIVALISPFAKARQMAREIIGSDSFFEVFVQCPLEVAKQRDPKGLYAKAAAGELKNFTGIDSVYEAPENPDLVVQTNLFTPANSAELVLKAIQTKLMLRA